MKIITWNCNMAFRKKAELILAHKPDILVVPECEHPDKLKFPANTPKPKSLVWIGSNHNKGLGIFSYSEYRFKVLPNHDPELRTIIPISVSGGTSPFTMFAIWAHNPFDPDGTYVEQIWKALTHYDNNINATQTMLVGDFNSNTIWDKKYRKSNHSNVVQRLAGKNIHSVYHLHHKQAQGREQHPTLYMYRHKDKPYHIDYCFVSKDLADRLHSVEVGEYEAWKQHSDHVPLIVTFNPH